MTHKEFAISLAKEAGEMIREGFFAAQEKTWKSHDLSPVTQVDKDINHLALTKARETFPDIGFLGEEGSKYDETHKFLWVCDPIDGTIPFIHGLPLSTFSLGLVDRVTGKSLLGVVYEPYLDRLFIAQRNKGATMNNEKIMVSDEKILSHRSLLSAPVGSKRENMNGLIDYAQDTKRARIINTRSAVIYGALTASGKITGLVEPCGTPWDNAAISILVEEAGGRVTTIDGSDYRCDQKGESLLYSNGHVHDELLKIINDVE